MGVILTTRYLEIQVATVSLVIFSGGQMSKKSSIIVVIFALVNVLGTAVYAEGMKHEIGVGIGLTDVEGQDSGFPLDGEIDTPTIYYGLDVGNGLIFDARFGFGDGEFKLTTGEKTDYESTTIDLRLGWSFCWSESCSLKVQPYLGYNRFSSENKLTAFGTAVKVDQERTKIPVGAEISLTLGRNEFGVDLQMGYKSDENQDIAVLGVDQDADSEWSPGVELYARHTFPNRVFLQAEWSYVEDDFDESGGNRSANEETSTLTFSMGRKF
jgi:hypothetical protein